MASPTDGREFELTPGVGDGQGGLVRCDSWDRKESDTTEPNRTTRKSMKVPQKIKIRTTI